MSLLIDASGAREGSCMNDKVEAISKYVGCEWVIWG